MATRQLRVTVRTGPGLECYIHERHKSFFSSGAVIFGNEIKFGSYYDADLIAVPEEHLKVHDIIRGSVLTFRPDGTIVSLPEITSTPEPLSCTAIATYIADLEQKAAKYDALQAALRSVIEK